MTALQSYQFDENPVRIVIVANDPWFVAGDLAQALGYKLASDMCKMLDDDERGMHIVHTLGGQQEMLIVSESGMYAAVLKSRKPEARRFRKWVTAEVLPELRRTGQYRLGGDDAPPQIAADLDPPRLMAGVAVVREARRLWGPQAARNLWPQVGLPAVSGATEGDHGEDPLADPLRVWCDGRMECTISEAAEGIGLRDIDHSTRYRIGRILSQWGWKAANRKVAPHRTARVFTRPAVEAAQ